MDASPEPQTWHYGVVAKWWAEFLTEGPEIDFFRRFVEAGQPALDVGCGTGRLLIPYLKAGLDVDGCDLSTDMIALCRERAEREGLSPNLRVQPMHRLDMPRRYRTIYLCGSFGLGEDRTQGAEALRWIHDHLEPGGVLVLDHAVLDKWDWDQWTKEKRPELPEPWPDAGDRRTGSDGREYELRARIVSLDPLAQRLTKEMRGLVWKDGVLIEQDEHVLTETSYYTHELTTMIERAGFSTIELQADYTESEPTADTDSVVFIARKPSG